MIYMDAVVSNLSFLFLYVKKCSYSTCHQLPFLFCSLSLRPCTSHIAVFLAIVRRFPYETHFGIVQRYGPNMRTSHCLPFHPSPFRICFRFYLDDLPGAWNHFSIWPFGQWHSRMDGSKIQKCEKNINSAISSISIPFVQEVVAYIEKLLIPLVNFSKKNILKRNGQKLSIFKQLSAYIKLKILRVTYTPVAYTERCLYRASTVYGKYEALLVPHFLRPFILSHPFLLNLLLMHF